MDNDPGLMVVIGTIVVAVLFNQIGNLPLTFFDVAFIPLKVLHEIPDSVIAILGTAAR